jgi:hypothetical protein
MDAIDEYSTYVLMNKDKPIAECLLDPPECIHCQGY